MRCMVIYALLALAVVGTGVLSALVHSIPPERQTPFQRWWAEGDNAAYALGAAVTVILGGGLTLHALKSRRERAAWAAFAAAYGFEDARLEDGRERLVASYRGREVVLRMDVDDGGRGGGAFRAGFDEGSGGNPLDYQVLTVELRGAPAGLKLRSRDVVEAAVDRWIVEPLLARSGPPLGEELGFDPRVEVTVADPDTLRAWLTPRRLELLGELLAGPGGSLEDGALAYTRIGRSPTREELTAALERLMDVAERLEAS